MSKSEIPIVTLEVNVQYKTKIYECLTSIPFDFWYSDKSKFLKNVYLIGRDIKAVIYIESSNEFSFNSLSDDIKLKFLKIISPQKIEYKGPKTQFNFKLNDYKLPLNEKAFYCYDSEEISKLEELMNKKN